jgi:RNA polymerase sigma-70 factor (ECF subfamily)
MTTVPTAPKNEFSDEDLVRQIMAGDIQLYGRIMKKYNQRMYRICMSIVHNSFDSEDIMQNSYLKAYENLPAFKFESKFSTWLTKILINECLLYKKRTQRVTLLNERNFRDELNDETPIYNAMNTELRNILENALIKLPEKYRLVFVMREVEDMSTAETMECLSLSESNVKVRLNRAKELLRTSLSQYYKTEELFDFHLSKCDKIVANVLSIIRQKMINNPR